MEIYNQNRDNNNGMHDEIKEQNAKLKDASLKEKLIYFKDYYLLRTILIIAAICTVGGIAYSIITSPDDTAFQAFLFNNTGDPFDDTLSDEYIVYSGIDTKEHYVIVDTTLTYSNETYTQDIRAAIDKTMSVLNTGELDIIIGDQMTIDYYALGDCFCDITTILPQEIMTQFADRLYYYTSEETGITLPVGIYVGDSPKLQQLSYYTDKEPILGITANSNSIDNAITFLRYLYDQK